MLNSMSFRPLLLLGVAVASMVFADEDADNAWKALIEAAGSAVAAKDLPQAEKLFGQAVQATSRFTPDDPRVGISYNYLGLICKEERKYPEAEKAYGKALAVLERVYGPASLDVGNVNFNLASVAMAEGHYDSALPYIARSRGIFETILGRESPKYQTALCMMGDSYRNLKKLDEARINLKLCADAREATGGVDNADLADALLSLGLVYEQQGRYDKADPTLKLAEKIREKTLGVTSPEFAEALDAHANVLKIMGRAAEADRESAMAAAIRRAKKTAQ
jgi:tetratricopeptide (TPR) repeat protein